MRYHERSGFFLLSLEETEMSAGTWFYYCNSFIISHWMLAQHQDQFQKWRTSGTSNLEEQRRLFTSPGAQVLKSMHSQHDILLGRVYRYVAKSSSRTSNFFLFGASPRIPLQELTRCLDTLPSSAFNTSRQVQSVKLAIVAVRIQSRSCTNMIHFPPHTSALVGVAILLQLQYNFNL